MWLRSAVSIVLLSALVGCGARSADGPPPHTDTDAPAKTSPTPDEQTATLGDTESLSLRSRIAPPGGYRRLDANPGSYADWLRHLPVRPGRPEVRLYDGRRKLNQSAHHAVLDVDVGSHDLQQCADAVIRLRAEFLFAGPCREGIQFNFTSGDAARWTEWRDGIRPTVRGNRVSWSRTTQPDDGYSNFREYLDVVFMYAGSASLEQELLPVSDPARPEIGDVFIEGGFPGHAVLVIDVAENEAGERVFLIAQSYMPAQDIHILRGPDSINPWYPARSAGVLETPEWDFYYHQLRRFPRTPCDSGGETSGR